MYQYVLALSLLASTDPIPTGIDGENLFNHLKASLIQISIEKEILDPRESRYILTSFYNCFYLDMELLRKRYHEFKDAPPVEDAMRFPDRKYINELMAFNGEYRSNMDRMGEAYNHRRDEYKEVIKETDKIRLILDAAWDASCDYYYVSVRRNALLKLKSLIGNNAYYSGELPPPVPVWRLREIK
jgi:hypothetical protein